MLVFSPVRRFLEQRARLPASVGAVLIVSALVALLVTVLVVLSTPVSELIQDAPKIGRQLERKLRGVAESARAVAEAGEQVDKLTGAQVVKTAPGPGTKPVQEVVVRKPGFAESLATVAPTVLTQAVFTLVLLLFLLASGDLLYEKIVRSMPTFADKVRALRIAYDIERNLSRYLFTITVINAALGVAIGIAMWWLDMPNPLLFAVMGFLFNYVPYLGAVVGVAIATVYGLITFSDLWSGLLPGIVYFALTSIEGQLITPHLVGRRLEMNTVVVFISVAFWAWLWSVMGMLVAVPLLVTLYVICQHVPRLQAIGEFLSPRGREKLDANGAPVADAQTPP
jgi:predicted PurR-regulated permease PerM